MHRTLKFRAKAPMWTLFWMLPPPQHSAPKASTCSEALGWGSSLCLATRLAPSLLITCPPTAITMMKWTSSFSVTSQGNLTFFKPTCSRRAKEPVSSGSRFGSTPPPTTTPTPFSKTKTSSYSSWTQFQFELSETTKTREFTSPTTKELASSQACGTAAHGPRKVATSHSTGVRPLLWHRSRGLAWKLASSPATTTPLLALTGRGTGGAPTVTKL